jgi:hypothetical protein
MPPAARRFDWDGKQQVNFDPAERELDGLCITLFPIPLKSLPEKYFLNSAQTRQDRG